MEVAVQVRIVWNQMRGVQLTRPSQRVAFGARLMRSVTWTEWEYFEFWHLHYLQVFTSNRIKLSAFIELKWPLFSMLQLVCWPLGGSGIGSWVGKCPCCTRNAAVLSAMPIPKVRLLALMVGLHVCALIRVRRSNIWEDALWAVKRTFDDKKHIHVTFLWESAVDGGGPRRECFMLLMNAIKENNSVRRCLHQTCSTSQYNITRRALPMYGQNDSPFHSQWRPRWWLNTYYSLGNTWGCYSLGEHEQAPH